MRAAIYIRKSRKEKDRPDHRLTVQREQLPAYAETQGWQYEIYDDGHASAARGKIEDLRQRSRLEADIHAGTINIILTIELSRLSRDDSLQDYVAWLHLCSEHSVKLATMSRTLDPAQHSDWMLLLMEGGFSSVEMKILQSRMKEGRDQALRAGKYLGGPVPPPYRYDKELERPVIDQKQLPKMKTIWTLAEEYSTREISRRAGLPLITIRRMLEPERLLFCQGLRQIQDQLVACEWEPAITADQAEKILTNRKKRKRGYTRAKAAGLLSSLKLLTCGYCGAGLRAHRGIDNRSGKALPYAYYTCNSKGHAVQRTCEQARMHRQEDIDSRVITHIIGTLENMAALKLAWAASKNNSDIGQKLHQIIDQEKKLTTKKERIVAAIAEGVIDFADARQQRQIIDTDLENLRKQRNTVQAAITREPPWDALRLSQEDFDCCSVEEQREIFRLCLKQIKVYRTYFILDYRFPRNTSGTTLARAHLPQPLKPGRKTKKLPDIGSLN